MAKKLSAGLLMYRYEGGQLQVFLSHPGGPYCRNKDEGYWSIPKGEVEENEELLATAIREFSEETGIQPNGDFINLQDVKQKGGKRIHAWAFRGEWNETFSPQSFFDMTWPPKSGQIQKFPEVDQVRFFSVPDAKMKINSAQIEFITRLEEYLAK